MMHRRRFTRQRVSSTLMRLANLIFAGHGPKSRGLNTSYVEDTAYRYCERMDKDDMETQLTAP